MGKYKPVLREKPKGLLSYDLGASASMVFPICTKLQEKFGLKAGRIPVIGLDTILVELIHKKRENEYPIVVGWDNWSDVFIMAMDKGANEIIREIAGYFDTILDDLFEMEQKLQNQNESKNKL